MPITYHEQGRYRKLPLVRALFFANALFALLVLVAWQGAILVIIGPLAWATSQSVTFDENYAHLFEYPLIFYWATPAAAMTIANIMIKNRSFRAAFGILLLPLALMAISMTMYWIVPH